MQSKGINKTVPRGLLWSRCEGQTGGGNSLGLPGARASAFFLGQQINTLAFEHGLSIQLQSTILHKQMLPFRTYLPFAPNPCFFLKEP